MLFRLALATFALLLSSCGKESNPPNPRAYSDLSTSLKETKSETKRLLGPEGNRARALWDHVPGADLWTATALSEIATLRPLLERTRDRDEFCPDYDHASDFEKDTCWLRFLSAIARFESDFRPGATYLEATGSTSVGLLMMNPSHCPKADNIEKLKDPVANIQCASQRLGLLLRRDGWLSGPGNTGGAAYWSVLREPYQVGTLHLGRRPHILLFTRSYRAFRDPSL